MTELPELLLAYGVTLKKSGSGFICKCIAHDDHNPSMSVYINGTGKYVSHCHSCGFHEDVIGCWQFLTGNDSYHEAVEALDLGIKPLPGVNYGNIQHRPSKRGDDRAPERVMLLPPDDAPVPRMDYLQSSDGVKFGDPESVWVFRQPNGAPLLYEARYMVTDLDTGEIKKQPRVFTYGVRGKMPPKWECAHYIGKRPIYGLDLIAKTTGVIAIFEGCRKAAYAQGFVDTDTACTAWAGGAEVWNRSEWKPIAGRECLLFPDADAIGRKAIDALAVKLVEIGCTVHIVDDKSKAHGWDICDAQWTQESFNAFVERHKGDTFNPAVNTAVNTAVNAMPDANGNVLKNTLDWPKPVDVFDDWILPQVTPDMLPEAIGEWCIDMGGVVGADPSIFALTAIVAAASMLHDDIKIQPMPNNPAWTESARLWGAVVGNPSSKKSPAMGAALSVVKRIDSECNDNERKIKHEHSVVEKIYAKQESAYIERLSKGEQGLEMPRKPDMPEIPRAIAQDFTIEALREILKHSSRGILAERDELSGWFGSMDAYKNGKGGSDRAAWLETYNGGARRIERVSAGSVFVKNWSACIIGGIQPEPMEAIAGSMHEDGLLQRFMVVYGKPGCMGNGNAPIKALDDRYRDMIRQIWMTTPGIRAVQLGTSAQRVRKDIAEHAYKLIGVGYISTAMSAHLGKWEGLTARLLLTYHACECAIRHVHPEAADVSEDTAQRVRAFMLKMLLPHSSAFYANVLGGSEQNKQVHAVANLILANHDGEIRSRDITIGWAGWRMINENAQKQVLQRLIDCGWIRPADDARYGKNGMPTRYHINPTLHAANAERVAAEKARRLEVISIIKEVRGLD